MTTVADWRVLCQDMSSTWEIMWVTSLWLWQVAKELENPFGQDGVVFPSLRFEIMESKTFFPKQFTVGVLNATLDLAALVLVGVVSFLGSEVVLSPVVSGCLPSCGGWGVVGVAASRTKTFRNQNHRFQSKFAYCELFGVYAGVIFV